MPVVLRRWLGAREKLNPKTKALFISYQTLGRPSRNGVYAAVVKYARYLGLKTISDHTASGTGPPRSC